MKPLKLGDIVEWTSQSAGSRCAKRGLIEQVVPANEWHAVRARDRRTMRDHESYVVRASRGNEDRNRLYWPRVSALRLVTP